MQSSLSNGARKELIQVLRDRYWKVTRVEKSKIFNPDFAFAFSVPSSLGAFFAEFLRVGYPGMGLPVSDHHGQKWPFTLNRFAIGSCRQKPRQYCVEAQ
jgi:hypothetical protein